MKKIFFLFCCVLCVHRTFSQEVDSAQMWLDEVEFGLSYEKGEIKLSNGVATIKVPAGFKYLNGPQTVFIVNEVWGNPLDTTTLGLLLPEDAKVTASESWAFIITYDEMGYVEDDDADDIDYEELIEGMRTDMAEGN